MILVLAYAVIMRVAGFQDFWWKTSMCFPAGFIVAKYRDQIDGWLSGRKLLLLPIVEVISFGFILADSRYMFIPQIVAFELLSSAFVFMGRFSKFAFFDMVGKLSFEIYLVHIGLLKIVYSAIENVNIATLVYVGLVAILSMAANYVARRIPTIR